MKRASSRPPSLPVFVFWLMVFAVSAGLYKDLPLLLLAGLVAPPVLLLVWALRSVR